MDRIQIFHLFKSTQNVKQNVKNLLQELVFGALKSIKSIWKSAIDIIAIRNILVLIKVMSIAQNMVAMIIEIVVNKHVSVRLL